MNSRAKITTKKLCIAAVLAAFSVILMYLIRIPYPAAPYLEYDPANIPIIIGTLLLGPIYGLELTFVVSVLQGITVSSGSGIIGIIMHFIATGTMVIVTGAINRKFTFSRRTYIAVILGSISMILMMIPVNLIFTPIYTGASMKDVAGLLLPVIVPFNSIKAVINAAIGIHMYLAVYYVLVNSKFNIDK